MQIIISTRNIIKIPLLDDVILFHLSLYEFLWMKQTELAGSNNSQSSKRELKFERNTFVWSCRLGDDFPCLQI